MLTIKCERTIMRFMKNLSEQLSVRREVVEITMTEFRQKPGQVLMLAELGKVFVITKCSKPVAVLSKVPGEQLAIAVLANGQCTFKLQS